MLELLRKVKRDGVDDSQYIHTLTYNDLLDEVFCEITAQEHKRLCVIERGLEQLVLKRSVPKTVMLKALTKEEHAEYIESYDADISHAESEAFDMGVMPLILSDYLDYVKAGDRYTRIANLFKRSKKRDMNGQTAFGRYEAKAFGCYEEALMLIIDAVDTNPLTNPKPDVALSSEILRWLDRDVDTQQGYEPDISAEGVPRLIGSKSKYCLVKAKPVVGERLRNHWRQREALVKSALMLLYEEDALERQMEQGFAASSKKLREKLARMKAAKGMKG